MVKTYSFKLPMKNIAIEICGDDILITYPEGVIYPPDNCEKITVNIYPKITERVVNRVAELTGGRVVFSSLFNTYIFNKIVMTRARRVAKEIAFKQYQHGKVESDLTVIVDLDETLDEELRHAARTTQ